MKRSPDPVQLIRSANPVPHGQLPDASSPEATFKEILMMRTNTPAARRLRRRPGRVAVAAAVLIVLTATAAAAIAFRSGNLEEPAFSGDGWELIVGEDSNGESGTFKVCHQFVPADGLLAERETAFGPSGCSDWPSVLQPDVIIVDAVVAIDDADSVVIFVDLGTVPITSLVALLADGTQRDVTPFTMPQSRKQFAVVELPGGSTAVSLEAIGASGQILDTNEVLVSN